MNREIWDRWCERGILGLLLGILIFSPLAFGAARLQEFLVVQALTCGVLVLWLARIWLAERPRLLLPPLSWTVLVFIFYAIWRYSTCDVEYVGRLELLRFLVYAVLFFAVLTNLHRQESTQIISFTLFGVGVFAAGYAVYQFVSGSFFVWGEPSSYPGRGSGPYVNPNHLAGFLEMLVPLATAYLISGRGKPVTKILIGYAALVMTAGIVASASRGSWASVGIALVALGVVFVGQKSFRWRGVALLLLLAIGAFFAFQKMEFFKKRIDQGIVGGKLDVETRLVMWDAAVRMWKDHFWFGVGPGHYDLRFRGYRPASVQLQPERVHNDYLNTLADLGVAGAIPVAAAIILLVWGVIRVWGHVKRGERAFTSAASDKFAFVAGAAMGFLALALHAVLDFNMQIPANAIVAMTLLALLTSHWRFATERFWFSLNVIGKAVVSLMLALSLGYLAWQEVRLVQEWYWQQQARRAELNSLAQADLLKKAYAAEPQNGNTAYAIGEIYRLNSLEGKSDYAELAAQAIEWYQRGITNNPYNSYNYLRWGMVLDFLNRHDEAEKLFFKADELDPNGYYTCAHVGRHYVESGQYAAARPWLERSLRLWWRDNPIAEENLRIANQRLLEAAQDPVLLKLREQMRLLSPE